MPPAQQAPSLKTEFVNATLEPFSEVNAFLLALLDMVTLEVNANNATKTVLLAMETNNSALNVSMDMPLIKSMDSARKLPTASSDNISPNHPTDAPESALKTLTSMKMSASPLAYQDSMITESEDASPPLLKPDAQSPTSSAMEFVSATAHQEPILTLKTESARVAHPTVSVASPTPSVMLAMLDTISKTESVLLPLLTAQLDNSDTMESATEPALKEAAPKETSAKEPALLEHGITMEAATETAQLN